METFREYEGEEENLQVIPYLKIAHSTKLFFLFYIFLSIH